MTDTAPSAPWTEHSLPDDGATIRVPVGPVELMARIRTGELHLAHRPIEDAARTPAPPRGRSGQGTPPEGAPSEPAWARWAFTEPPRAILLEPALPDRPLVVTPDPPFRLFHGAEARVYVRVPLSIRVQLRGEAAALLEVPSVVMSDTWWGDPTAGELAYWLPTTARRGMEPHLFQPHLAVCSLLLSNHSEQDLLVDRLALRVAHLALFRREDEIWSEETRVRYQGDEDGSQIEMTGAPPPEARNARPMAPPRSPAPRGFKARTFERLRSIAPLGWG